MLQRLLLSIVHIMMLLVPVGLVETVHYVGGIQTAFVTPAGSRLAQHPASTVTVAWNILMAVVGFSSESFVGTYVGRS
jgi:predicted membrane chloride channel (bestrophin family)